MSDEKKRPDGEPEEISEADLEDVSGGIRKPGARDIRLSSRSLGRVGGKLERKPLAMEEEAADE